MPIKYPCTHCDTSGKINQRSICCDLPVRVCQMWTHLKCSDLTPNEFTALGKSNETFTCNKCYKDMFPFSKLTDSDFKDELADKTLLDHDYQKAASIFPDSRLSDVDDENCYISSGDFLHQYKNNKDFFLLNINMRSLKKIF